jgi:hypothetical protein
VQNSDPNKGPPTDVLNAYKPVKVAKIVASTLKGVIFVNKTTVGKKLKASDNVSEITLQRNVNGKSFIKGTLILSTRVKFIRAPKSAHSCDSCRSVRNSQLVKYLL